MRTPRFPLWMLMALVALVALSIGVPLELRRRSERFWELSHIHEELAEKFIARSMGRAASPDDERYLLRQIDYHIDLRAKYRLAGTCPWFPVPPDPPPPD
jgi:hypothetical protein